MSVDVTRKGSITYRIHDTWDEAMRMPSNCSLDWADDGSRSFAQVAKILGVTKEWIRREAEIALQKLRAYGLSDLSETETPAQQRGKP
jgi:hypothetical protein